MNGYQVPSYEVRILTGKDADKKGWIGAEYLRERVVVTPTEDSERAENKSADWQADLDRGRTPGPAHTNMLIR